MAGLPSHFAQLIGLIRAEDLAEEWGYAGTNSAFRTFCAKLGLRHVPGRPGWFDPQHVRQRLDAAQGMSASLPRSGEAALSLVEQRRARNASA